MDARAAKASPFRVTIPHALNGLLELRTDDSVLRLAVVERAYAKNLHDIWDVTGVYVLLDRPDGTGAWGAYVGKAAPGTLSNRLRTHLRRRDHWYRALLVRRVTEDPFHTSQVGWLEGCLYDILVRADLVHLHNGNRPQDRTLHLDDQAGMTDYLRPIFSALHLIGHNLSLPAPVRPSRSTRAKNRDHVPPYELLMSETTRATGDGEDRRPAQSTKARHKTTMLDLIQAGLLQPGARLYSTATPHPAEATLNSDGSIQYDGKAYEYLSGAGKAVTEYDVNGWTFWEIETSKGIRSLASVRAELEQRRKARPAYEL
ncbi:hypothetical protein HII36_19190 [Nonomuraea sp. NN258]|uniref:restriction system modified-DNA reader domain-containing protein n=1 Tax=Nonomuraea antri TaxID=2730852 RepID=UPI001567DEDE|nr:hypothetical protein [Nonomuraea antri]NRQ33959.1 hypothetical protein [Nonomuraea antri]